MSHNLCLVELPCHVVKRQESATATMPLILHKFVDEQRLVVVICACTVEGMESTGTDET